MQCNGMTAVEWMIRFHNEPMSNGLWLEYNRYVVVIIDTNIIKGWDWFIHWCWWPIDGWYDDYDYDTERLRPRIMRYNNILIIIQMPNEPM